MPRETSEVPESVVTYLSQVAAGGVVEVSGHCVPVPLGPFRAIGSLVLGEGWSGVEPWGVWNDGDSAILYLKNVEAQAACSTEYGTEIIFEARGAVSEKHPRLPVRFRLGSSHSDFVFSWPGMGRATIKLPVPAELVQTPVLRIEICIDGPMSAFQQTEGRNPDQRRVGIGIETVQVRRYQADRTVPADAQGQRQQKAIGSAERSRPAIVPIPGGRSNVIALTMVYNEGDALRRWINHYGRHLGEKNLLIVDDGSDDQSTHDIGLAGRLAVPRKLADDGERADFVSDLQRTLLRYYDAVIYADCDEFLVPDPRRFANLREYVDRMTADCVRPVAFNVIQRRREEPELDQSRPILDQRAYCQFFTPECKPSLAKVAIRYMAGFHHCDKKALLDPALLLVHSKLADFSAALARLALTRNMRWSDRAVQAGWGNHSRAEDKALIATFESVEAMLRNRAAVEPLDPDNLAATVNAEMEEQGPPYYRFQPFTGPLSIVPEWLRGSV